MLSLNFSPKDSNLTSLCNNLLNSKYMTFYCNCRLNHNSNWIANNFQGVVSEKIFLRFLDDSVKSHRKQRLLVAMVDMLEAPSITNAIFDSIMNYPITTVRDAMDVCLCHKRLNESQLRTLCYTGNHFECFFELSQMYYSNDNYSLEDVISISNQFKNGPFSYMYLVFLQEMFDCTQSPNSDKIRWLSNELANTLL